MKLNELFYGYNVSHNDAGFHDRSAESCQSRYHRYQGALFLFFRDKYGAVLYGARCDPPISCRTRRRLSTLGQWITKIHRPGKLREKQKKKARGSSAFVRLQVRIPSSEGNNLCICGLRKNAMSSPEFDYNRSSCTLHCTFSVKRDLYR